jgi:hypothetical protein
LSQIKEVVESSGGPTFAIDAPRPAAVLAL